MIKYNDTKSKLLYSIILCMWIVGIFIVYIVAKIVYIFYNTEHANIASIIYDLVININFYNVSFLLLIIFVCMMLNKIINSYSIMCDDTNVYSGMSTEVILAKWENTKNIIVVCDRKNVAKKLIIITKDNISVRSNIINFVDLFLEKAFEKYPTKTSHIIVRKSKSAFVDTFIIISTNIVLWVALCFIVIFLMKFYIANF